MRITGVLLFLLIAYNVTAANISSVDIAAPCLKGVPATIEFTLNDLSPTEDSLPVTINGSTYTLKIENGKAEVKHPFHESGQIIFESGAQKFEKKVNPIPLWWSVIPPLLAIIMALIFKEVYLSLFTGIFSGTFIINYFQEQSLWQGISRGFLSIADTYIIDALKDPGHVSIIVFSMLIGGTVSIVHSNGGMKGLVERLAKYARSKRSGQLITWFLGLFIFFDDYANTLVVGNTMRPVTDRLKISREKLAYIVDSTAAPIASIAFVTTWIGAELSYIKEGLIEIGLNQSAYSVFIGSLKYSFYPIFTLAFVLMLILMRRDYGPMLFVERLSTNTRVSKNTIDDSIKTTHWINGILPVAVVIIGTIAGLIITGTRDFVPDPTLSWFQKISLIIGNADSYVALLWSSLLGALVAVSITISQKLLSVQKTMEALMDGFKSMLPAVVVLIMAWSLAELTSEMKTALFISNVLVNFKMAPWLIPAITFVMSALVAFSTGSSWGTMAILYPLILPVTWLICHNSGLSHDTSMAIFYNVVSVVLAGSVMGDHCSPISDTTIMSSLASGCNHISHVKTQMPYALTVGAVALLVGTIPAALGIAPFWLFVAGLIVLYTVIRTTAKETTDNI